MTTTITVQGEPVEIHFASSDQHVGHRNIARLAGRPFDNSDSTNHMDETLIQNWNNMVRPEDNVLVLGDVALGSITDSLEKWKRFNGTLFLVPGNHDRVSSVESEARQTRFRPLYEDAGFIILDETINVMIDGVPALASHYPYKGDSGDHVHDRHVNLRPVNEGLPLIHGHTHAHKATDPVDYPRQFHVGADAHDYKPVPIEVIENWVHSL